MILKHKTLHYNTTQQTHPTTAKHSKRKHKTNQFNVQIPQQIDMAQHMI